jgi:hypothetical protein
MVHEPRNNREFDALSVAVDFIVNISNAPYLGAQDWESNYKNIMISSARTLREIELILDPKKGNINP